MNWWFNLTWRNSNTMNTHGSRGGGRRDNSEALIANVVTTQTHSQTPSFTCYILCQSKSNNVTKEKKHIPIQESLSIHPSVRPSIHPFIHLQPLDFWWPTAAPKLSKQRADKRSRWRRLKTKTTASSPSPSAAPASTKRPAN